MEDDEFMASPVVQKMASSEDVLNDAFKFDTEQKEEQKEKDPIREYLHLTASAVKMKYPKVEIETGELIKRVESLAFYQYHDQMVRIIQMEAKKRSHGDSIDHMNNLMAVKLRQRRILVMVR